jgi:hypothetical protein
VLRLFIRVPPSDFVAFNGAQEVADFVAARMTEPGKVRVAVDGADFLVSVYMDVQNGDHQHRSSANKILAAIEQAGVNAAHLVATRLVTRMAEGLIGGTLSGLGLSSKAKAEAAPWITAVAALLGGIAGHLVPKEVHMFEWRRTPNGWFEVPPAQQGTQPGWAY